MPEKNFGPLRLFDAHTDDSGSLPPRHERNPGPENAGLLSLAETLAIQETLRSSRGVPLQSPTLSLQWYLDLEYIRHHRQGKWIPRLLEFGKHQGERLLGLGNGLGSDLVPYARHGAHVIAACHSKDQLGLIKRNFELRGLPGHFLHALPNVLPIDSVSIDVICLTGVLTDLEDSTPLVNEMYRVLKPGGKILVVAPAYYNINYWCRLLRFDHSEPAPSALETDPVNKHKVVGLFSPSAHRFRAADLRKIFDRFPESRVRKRHLRRSEVPSFLRWAPLSLLEKFFGKLVIYKGFKPVQTCLPQSAAA
ncbi:MAG: class I SAM-dependent methyltransferase [Gemmataceae bacterium]